MSVGKGVMSMYISTDLMATMRSKAGYREHSILDNLDRTIYHPENGYRIVRFTDKKGNSAEYSLKLNRWTN